jgi:hypothetical protein
MGRRMRTRSLSRAIDASNLLQQAFRRVGFGQVEDLAQETKESGGPPSSLLYCPFSLGLLETCLRPFAQGATRSQLDHTFSNTDATDVLHSALELLGQWETAANQAQFETGTILLYDDKRYDVDARLTKECGALLDAPLALSDWKAANARISALTHGRFPNELQGPPFGPFAAINAVFFKSEWEDPFPAYETTPTLFQLQHSTAGNKRATKKTIELPVMRDVAYRRMVIEKHLEMLELPMKGGFDMCFVLFRGTAADTPSLYDAWPLLDAANQTSDAQHQSLRVDYSIPRFTQTHEATWTPACLLDASFDFIRSKDGAGTVPSANWKLLQKAIIVVTETGAEAAAITEMACGAVPPMGGKPPPPPHVFAATRPFFYFIRHRASRVILFFGVFHGQ